MSNRELANLLILLLFASALLASRTGRGIALSLGKIVFGRLLAIYVAYSLYLGMAIFIAYEIGMWEEPQAKDTALWLAMAGTALFGTFGEVGRYPKVLRKRLVEMVGAGAMVEFVFNLVSFALVVELILAVVLTVLYMLLAVAASRAETKSVAVFIQVVLGVLLLGMLVGTALSLYHQRNSLEPGQLWRSFAMIFWLPLVACPAIYLIGVIVLYENLGIRVRRFAPGRAVRLLLLVATHLRWRVRLVRGFGGDWLVDMCTQESREGARTVIRAYRQAHTTTLMASARAESLRLEASLSATTEVGSALPAPLIEDRIAAWEFGLYANALSRILAVVDDHADDIRKGPTIFDGRLRDAGETVRHASAILDQASALGNELSASFDRSAQNAAFGEPGQPGNARLIIRLAYTLGHHYARFRELERTADAYEVRPHRLELTRLRDATARMCSEPVRQVSDFAAAFSSEVATMPERMERGDPIDLTMVLSLEISDEALDDYHAALDAVRRNNL